MNQNIQDVIKLNVCFFSFFFNSFEGVVNKTQSLLINKLGASVFHKHEQICYWICMDGTRMLPTDLIVADGLIQHVYGPPSLSEGLKVGVHVCVWEREGMRETGRERERQKNR